MNTIDCPKCQHHHEPSGDHEADSGEHTCQECGFAFVCKIDYDPDYQTECAKHKWSGFEICDYCLIVRTKESEQ